MSSFAAGYASNQRDTCYGAFLRQLVANRSPA